MVASGTPLSRGFANDFPRLNPEIIHVNRAGTSWQRNAGLAVLDPSCTLVGFFDDDVTLDPDAVEKMLSFWETAPEDVGGAGFNFRNFLARETERKWSLGSVVRLYNTLMLRGVGKGKLLPSGFPTPVFPAPSDLQTDWLETLGLILRRDVVQEFQFDEFFAGYSYLEHVDYTYRVSRKYTLCVVSNAWVTHHSTPIKNSYLLGKMQVINRLHFVLKHRELSPPRCCFALVMNLFFNLVVGLILRDGGYLKRALGNVAGFTQAVLSGLAPVAGSVK